MKRTIMSVEDKYAQTIAIVYPAIAPSGDAYNIPIDRTIKTHVTVSLLGEIPEVDFTKEELITALRSIDWQETSDISVDKLELFGPKNDFLVMVLNAPSLQRNWESVNASLSSAGVGVLDKYPTYRPHITLMENYEEALPTPAFLPHTIKVGFPELWWGTETIPLRLLNT
jgi:2'-5' RNA ligase